MPTKPALLIVGGAGYIGSHMVDYARTMGYEPIVLDNLSTGHRDAVLAAPLVVGDVHDAVLLDQLFSAYHFAAVMHFASFIQVGESVIDPGKYYHNNVAGTITLLNAMQKWQVNNFIFSSTAAVYGEPYYTPIDENHPIAPLNPYGRSKWMVEQILQDFAQSYGLRYVALRYFNAAGADPAGRLCERHEPETHLIPLVLQVAAGQRDYLTVYGQNYATADGTCVRDYVHVWDLCVAHWLALTGLWSGAKSGSYNLGTGQGYSVRQVIEVASQVTGCAIPVRYGERRAGDPAVLVADARLAMSQLNWEPRYLDLQSMIEHVWRSAMFEKQKDFSQ